MAAPRREPQRDGFTADGDGPRFDRDFTPRRVPTFEAKSRRPHYLRVPKGKRPKRGWGL